jgi:hypothetical protein
LMGYEDGKVMVTIFVGQVEMYKPCNWTFINFYLFISNVILWFTLLLYLWGFWMWAIVIDIIGKFKSNMCKFYFLFKNLNDYSRLTNWSNLHNYSFYWFVDHVEKDFVIDKWMYNGVSPMKANIHVWQLPSLWCEHPCMFQL